MSSQNPRDQKLPKEFRLVNPFAQQRGEQQFADNYSNVFRRTENSANSRLAATMSLPAHPALRLIDSSEAETGHRFPPYVPRKRKCAEMAEQQLKNWAADLNEAVGEDCSVKMEKRKRSSSRHGNEAAPGREMPQANENVSAPLTNYSEVRCETCGFGHIHGGFMICCHASGCNKTYHMHCVGLANEAPQNSSQFLCPTCQVELTQSEAADGVVFLGSMPKRRDDRAARRIQVQRRTAVNERQINSRGQIQIHPSRQNDRDWPFSPDSRQTGDNSARFSKRARREKQSFSPESVLLSQNLANLVQSVDNVFDHYADELEAKQKRKASRARIRHRSPSSDRSGCLSSRAGDVIVAQRAQSKLYCICRQPDDGMHKMISCDNCQDWFHHLCIGMTDELAQTIRPYFCDACKAADPVKCRTRSVGNAEAVSQEPEDLPRVAGDVVKAELNQEDVVEENELKPAIAQETKLVIPRKDGLRERKPTVQPIKVKKEKVVNIRKPKPPPRVTPGKELRRIHTKRPKFQPNVFIPAKIRRQDRVDAAANDCLDWLDPFATMMMNDFTDVNDGEKLMLNQWNSVMYRFLTKHEPARCYMPHILRLFLAKHGAEIRAQGRDGNFMMHLISLYHFGAISKADLIELNQELAQIPRGQLDEMAAASSQAGSEVIASSVMAAANSQPGSSAHVVAPPMVAANPQLAGAPLIAPPMAAAAPQAASSSRAAFDDAAFAAFHAEMRAMAQVAVASATAMVAADRQARSAAQPSVEPAMADVNQKAGSSAKDTNEACRMKENTPPSTSQ